MVGHFKWLPDLQWNVQFYRYPLKIEECNFLTHNMYVTISYSLNYKELSTWNEE